MAFPQEFVHARITEVFPTIRIPWCLKVPPVQLLSEANTIFLIANSDEVK
jgi:hypothetical protein